MLDRGVNGDDGLAILRTMSFRGTLRWLSIPCVFWVGSCVNFHPLQPRRTTGKAAEVAALREPAWQILGSSVAGRPLRVAHYGTGARR
ncbi:MAG: hypothetical protein WCR59_11830, partial [Planctomycetota bacterium]